MASATSSAMPPPSNVVLPATSSSPMRSSSSNHDVRVQRTQLDTTRALLTKNYIVKKRHYLATISEIINPFLFIVLFVGLKTLEPDLEIPGGWAINTANKTYGTDNTTGSHWNLYAVSNLFSDLNSTLASAGLDGGTLNGVNASSSPEDILNATLPLLTSSSSPLSLLTLTTQLRLPRFYFTETTMPGLMLNLALQSLSEGNHLEELSQQDLLLCMAKFALLGYTSLEPTSLYAVPAECKGKVVPYKLAITPDTPYTRKYVAAILDEWYPRLALLSPIFGISPLTTPSFEDSRLFFDDETALETYLASQEYGLDLAHPKVYAAIAFQEFPDSNEAIGDITGHDITYSIRMNSTYTDTSFPNSVPRTIHRRYNLNKYIRSVKAQNTLIYTTRGFLTLQTAVMRVLNCLPAWDAARQQVVDAFVCQLTHAVMDTTNKDHSDRLLKQLDDDLIIGSILQALGVLGNVAGSVLQNNPNLDPSNPANVNSVVAKAIQAIADSAAKGTLTNIPDATKRTLLKVLRIAPQGYHGAAVYMSPTEAYHYAGFYAKILVVFPIGFILSYLYGVSRVIVALLMEKETRSREFMKILGVHDSQIVGTWLLTYVVLFCVASLLQTLGATYLLFDHSTGWLLFAFFFSFALSTFGFGFLVSTLFNRARAGSFVGMGLFFMMFFVSFSFKETSTEAARTLSCVFAPVALAQGINIIAQLETIGVGLTFANAHDNVGGFRFMNAVYMQLFDFGLYMAMGWYLEHVMPKEYGVREKWYFIVSPSYWRRGRRVTSRQSPGIEGQGLNTPSLTSPNAVEEPVAMELRQQERDHRAIVIDRLRKTFTVPGGTKVAVHGLSLSLYEGQITCLLGHNGAGKTTLMSMLTGMTPPTDGDAFIRGYSIRDDMAAIRQSLGYCPQFSVVYPELTVEEHLRFYARVKHHTTVSAEEDKDDQVDRMIREVGLTEKRHVQAHALSGGMKRKLSLAISFLGDSRVVFLDEPTSGMDPYSRRSTWELIQRNKAGRIVILTTHFMDEADLLGDRIAIMAEGELRCVGSSLFLKQKYGVGYRLSFVVGKSTSTVSHETVFNEIVTKHVRDAKLATDIGTELTFQLPFEASHAFPALFEEIDARKSELNVTSYAISVTTLEEIFLKVAETSAFATPPAVGDAKTHAKMNEMHSVVTMKEGGGTQTSPPRSTHLRIVWFFIQVRALLLKRVQSAKRDRAMLFYSTLLPIVVLVVGLSSLKLSLFTKNDPPETLTLVAQFPLTSHTPLPVGCVDVGGLEQGDDLWCRAAMAFVPDAVPAFVSIESPVYNGHDDPTVFSIPYTSPTIAPNDTTGVCLRFGQLAFERGYGKDSETMTSISTPIVNQYGGLLVQASRTHNVLAYNVLVNSSATHGAPMYKALADQAIHNLLLSSTGSSSPPPFRRVTVATHPFPLTFKTRSIFSSFLSLPAVMFVLIAFTFIPAALMPFLVKEKHREANARHQQLLSGVSLPAYWLANLLFDLALYIVPMVVAILLLRFYGVSSSLSGQNADSKACTTCTQHVVEAVVALFALFGTAIAPWTYAMSHVMEDPGACLLYTVMLNFLFGLVLLLTSYSLDSLDSTKAANASLVFVWRVSPLFSLANGLFRVIIADLEALFGFSGSTAVSAFSTDVAGYEIAYLAIQGPVFFVVALVVDMVKTGELTVCGKDGRVLWTSIVQRLCHRRGRPRGTSTDLEDHTDDAAARQLLLDDDADVKAERDRVLTSPTSSDIVCIRQLHKTYANGKKAVSNLTFGLQRGDCFGFLGINGAGKTTTLQILTGNLFPSFGSATLNGYDILSQRANVRRSIGYCPQFDALLDLLTVREHLELYGKLKGLDGHALRGEVDRILCQFQLQSFANKLAHSLSGGNKRKLSVAIAMLGAPALLFLDEPSTGMDPFSRRFMWDIILQVSVVDKTSTVVLTTHSMEECEALCNRAGIMVGGRLRCFGTIPHLKSRFGDGFVLECKLRTASGHEVDTCVDALKTVVDTGSTRVNTHRLHDACSALGDATRASWIVPGDGTNHSVVHPTGSVLYDQLQRSVDASLDVHELCAWWVLEDRVEALRVFLENHFGGAKCVALVERQHEFCRYKLTPSAANTAPSGQDPFSLARMFRLIEDARQSLGITEYSLAQTSLEQIFNAFARQQDEEKGVAKAFWNKV